MNQAISIAIVGAGPAGLTAACILQDHGWHASVFESDASPDARNQGGSLDLHADSGQLALERAGLLQAFLAVARHEDQQSRLLDCRSGEVIVDTRPAPGEGQRPEIDRAVLRTLFLDKLAPGTVHWGHVLRGVRPQADGRHMLDFHGRDSQVFDLVIGADGAWSKVRPALTEAMPVYTGITFVELKIERIDQRHPDLARLIGQGTMFALDKGAGLVAQRNGGGQVRIYAAIETPAEAGSRTDQSLAGVSKADLLGYFPGWAPVLLDLVRRADAVLAVRPIVALEPGLRWPARTGLTLVGDAAHVMPPVGVGVNLALLDAADLATALVSGENWKTAVHAAETAMLERAAGIAADARDGFAGMFGQDAQRDAAAHLQVSVAPARP